MDESSALRIALALFLDRASVRMRAFCIPGNSYTTKEVSIMNDNLGGTLQMAKVNGVVNTNLATVSMDEIYALEWVTIANPDQNRGNTTGPTGITINNASGPFVQGWAQGGLRMNRGEGMWYFDGKIYVMGTSGGSASRGTIWELNLVQQTLKCIYSSPSSLVGKRSVVSGQPH